MIQISDLRKGNYFRADGIIIKIVEVIDTKIVFIEYPIMHPTPKKRPHYKDYICIDNKDIIIPIPLDESILLDNPQTFESLSPGFIDVRDEQDDELSYRIDGDIKMTKIGSQSWLVSYNGINKTISSVDQLQNFYFDQKKKELEIEINEATI